MRQVERCGQICKILKGSVGGTHVVEEEGGVRGDFQVSGCNGMNVSVFVRSGDTERQPDLETKIFNHKQG